MRRLFAWDNDTLVGCFDERDGKTTFAYERDAVTLISLSLPIDGAWHEDAPAAFLDGLLPEEGARRIQMRDSLGAKSTSSFDLLERVDSTGGLVFTTTDSPPCLTAHATIATDQDIEAQMERIYGADDAWWHKDKRNRFSLAGNQGKFSLARIDGKWFWPNATLPSTHIIKPDGRRILDVAQVEHATMEVARRIGLSVATTEPIRYGEREGLLVERFDRVFGPRAKTIRRLRTEDMTQALGAWGRDKYDVQISEVVRRLHEADATDEVAYDLIRQVAFNAGIGNHDAHAKNYSIFLEPEGIRLTPLYDAISMAHWPAYRYDVLAMPVNEIYDPWEVTIEDWREEARRCRLDPDRVESIVRDVEVALLEVAYETLPCGPEIGGEIRTLVMECGRDLIPSLSSK